MSRHSFLEEVQACKSVCHSQACRELIHHQITIKGPQQQPFDFLDIVMLHSYTPAALNICTVNRTTSSFLKPLCDLCMASLRKDHADLLCVVPISTDVMEVIERHQTVIRCLLADICSLVQSVM